jgi:hypothetical protein
MEAVKMRRLAKAIETRMVVAFSDNEGGSHIVEPFTLGVHKDTGRVVLRCYGNLPVVNTESPESWKLFELENIDKLQVMPVKAKTERYGYEALDKEMSEIISFTVSNRRYK